VRHAVQDGCRQTGGRTGQNKKTILQWVVDSEKTTRWAAGGIDPPRPWSEVHTQFKMAADKQARARVRSAHAVQNGCVYISCPQAPHRSEVHMRFKMAADKQAHARVRSAHAVQNGCVFISCPQAPHRSEVHMRFKMAAHILYIVPPRPHVPERPSKECSRLILIRVLQ
jgi:predicted amidohydrolase